MSQPTPSTTIIIFVFFFSSSLLFNVILCHFRWPFSSVCNPTYIVLSGSLSAVDAMPLHSCIVSGLTMCSSLDCWSDCHWVNTFAGHISIRNSLKFYSRSMCIKDQPFADLNKHMQPGCVFMWIFKLHAMCVPSHIFLLYHPPLISSFSPDFLHKLWKFSDFEDAKPMQWDKIR